MGKEFAELELVAAGALAHSGEIGEEAWYSDQGLVNVTKAFVSMEDAKFIAAASPVVVLDLIRRLAIAESQVKVLNDGMAQKISALKIESDELILVAGHHGYTEEEIREVGDNLCKFTGHSVIIMPEGIDVTTAKSELYLNALRKATGDES